MGCGASSTPIRPPSSDSLPVAENKRSAHSKRPSSQELVFMEQRYSPLEPSNSTAKTDCSTEKLTGANQSVSAASAKDYQLPSTSTKICPEIQTEPASADPPKKSSKSRKHTDDSKDLFKATLERNLTRKLPPQPAQTPSVASSSPWIDRKISDCSELSARSVRSHDSISALSDNSFVVIRDRKVFAAWEAQLGRAPEANEITLHSGPKSTQPHSAHKPLVHSNSLEPIEISNIDEDSDDVTGLLSTVKLSPRRGSKAELKPLPKAPSPDSKSAGKQRSKRCKSETKSGKSEHRLPPLNTQNSAKSRLDSLTPVKPEVPVIAASTSSLQQTTSADCGAVENSTETADESKISDEAKGPLLPDVSSNRWQKFRQWSLPGLSGMIKPRGPTQVSLVDQKGDGQMLLSSSEVPVEDGKLGKKNPYYQRLIRSKTVASDFTAAEATLKVEVGGKRSRQRKLEDSISPSRREKRFFSQTRMISPTAPNLPSFKDIKVISINTGKKSGSKPKANEQPAKVSPTDKPPANKPPKPTGKKKSDYSQSCFPSLGKHRGSDTESLLSYREEVVVPVESEETPDSNANPPPAASHTSAVWSWKDVKMVHQDFFNDFDDFLMD